MTVMKVVFLFNYKKLTILTKFSIFLFRNLYLMATIFKAKLPYKLF